MYMWLLIDITGACVFHIKDVENIKKTNKWMNKQTNIQTKKQEKNVKASKKIYGDSICQFLSPYRHEWTEKRTNKQTRSKKHVKN